MPLWAAGRRYKAGTGSYQIGPVTEAPPKPKGLLDAQGRLFVKSRPQYEDLGVSSFLVATSQPYSMSNMGDIDQTAKINQFLKDAKAAGKVAYFPAGIYLVKGTVNVPTGSRIQGSSWSQVGASDKHSYGDGTNIYPR